ncbi:hypothetical protein FA13DRAFT_1899033 [Coprinellus micaceus]|uniref:Uncharacterized protein n=1 Tax=Coprinellus micaceus TaxID=71717 RepID=A0A4Y7STZ9_COPMI|nr:hypothetical protein FA13DRAFT_1899033 [Coprinellus micaceus]
MSEQTPKPQALPKEPMVYLPEAILTHLATDCLPKTLLPLPSEIPDGDKIYPQSPVWELVETDEYLGGLVYEAPYCIPRQMCVNAYAMTHWRDIPGMVKVIPGVPMRWKVYQREGMSDDLFYLTLFPSHTLNSLDKLGLLMNDLQSNSKELAYISFLGMMQFNWNHNDCTKDKAWKVGNGRSTTALGCFSWSGGIDTHTRWLGQEFIMNLGNNMQLCNLRSTIDIQVLVKSLYPTVNGQGIDMKELPYHPVKDHKLLNHWTSYWAPRLPGIVICRAVHDGANILEVRVVGRGED